MSALSNLATFIRSLSKYWLVMHIGSWMLFVLFLFFDESDSRPPMEFFINFTTRELLARVCQSASVIGFIVSCVLLAVNKRKLEGAVILFFASFSFVASIYLCRPYRYGSITQHDFEQLNGHGYYLISYPRLEFSPPGCGNCFATEYGYVLYDCGNGLGCEAVFCEIHSFRSNPEIDTYISTSDGVVSVYILGELAHTLDPNDSYGFLAGNCYQLPGSRE
jgi:hypothetical protein